MQRLGRVLHMTPSQNIIVKAEKIPEIGAEVVNENLQYVGTVFDVFGPISSPYIAVKTTTKDSKFLVNQTLYIVPSLRKAEKRKEKKK